MGTFVTLYLVALGVRLALIAVFPDPAYPDSFYYVQVARSLAAGEGLQVDFVWIFAEVGGRVPDVPALPIASNAHWMPLASIVQVPFIWALGPTAVASALPFALIGAVAAPLAFAIARDAGASPPVPLAAGVLTAVPVLTLVYMTQPDNFSLFQPLVAASLWLAARGVRGDGRSFAIAGLLAGFATLSRNDGVLVLATLGAVFLWSRLRTASPGTGTEQRAPVSVRSAVAAVGLFAVVVGPWLARQLAVFGTVSPSSASGKVLFIRSIEEWNSITTPADLDYFLGQGLAAVAASRAEGFLAALGIFAILVCGIVFVPFLIVGAWRRRRSRNFLPFFVYAALLFSFSALVSAVHVPGGTFIHSAVALVPHGYVLTMEGIVAVVAWVASRRRTWRAATATRFFVSAAVAFGIVAAAAGSWFVHDRYREERSQRTSVAAALDQEGSPRSDRLMSIDAAGYRYHTGRGGVVLVNDPIDTIERVARAYAVRWLVIERDDAVPAVAPILRGERPEWVGPPILTVVDDAGHVELAVYPVCASVGDDRCGEDAT